MNEDGKLSQDELLARLTAAKKLVKIGKKYQHYKSPDMMYVVKDIVLQEANNEPYVIYQALYGNHITFSRSVKVWNEQIEAEGKMVPRFRLKITE